MQGDLLNFTFYLRMFPLLNILLVVVFSYNYLIL